MNKRTPESIIIDGNYPSVYLDYVRSGEGRQHLKTDSNRRVWVKIVNNSVWSIELLTFTGDGGLDERGVFQNVEKIKRWQPPESVPIGYPKPDTGLHPFKIASGGSFIFSIPENHLRKNLMVRIEFTYEWENLALNSRHPIPTHSVTFSNSDLVRGSSQIDKE